MNKTNAGIWLWGGVTVALAFTVLVIVVWAGLYIIPATAADKVQYSFKDGLPQTIFRLFFALKENGSLVGGVLGFSGLAWSHFYKAPAPRSDEGV